MIFIESFNWITSRRFYNFHFLEKSSIRKNLLQELLRRTLLVCTCSLFWLIFPKIMKQSGNFLVSIMSVSWLKCIDLLQLQLKGTLEVSMCTERSHGAVLLQTHIVSPVSIAAKARSLACMQHPSTLKAEIWVSWAIFLKNRTGFCLDGEHEIRTYT